MITFNRPQARNAMTFAMYEDLFAACEAADADDEVRVLVLRGAGEKAFVAGTDIRQFAGFDESGADALAYEATIDRIVGRLETVRKPTVALVDGSQTWRATNADLGIAPDIDAAVTAALAYGKAGSLMDRLEAWIDAVRGEANVPFAMRAKGDAVDRWVAAAARDTDRAASQAGGHEDPKEIRRREHRRDRERGRGESEPAQTPQSLRTPPRLGDADQGARHGTRQQNAEKRPCPVDVRRRADLPHEGAEAGTPRQTGNSADDAEFPVESGLRF